MPAKEATARIKINKLLDAAGWRFFQNGNAPTNIRLEPGVTIKTIDLAALGDNFERATRGYTEAEQVSTNPKPELIARIKRKKIQAALARIWGKDELLSLES
jgi:type I restriction enzyme R subunit